MLGVFNSCGQTDPYSLDEVNVLNTDSLRAVLLEKSVGVQLPDGFVEELRVVLFSPESERHLENWYANKLTRTEEFGMALSAIDSAEVMFQTLLDKREIAEACRVKNAIGRMHTTDANYDSAIAAHKVAYSLAQQAGDSTLIGWCTVFFSHNFQLVADTSSAIEYGQRAVQMGQNHHDPAIEASALVILGGVAAMQRKHEASIVFMEKAKEIANTNGLEVIGRRAMLNIIYNFNQQKKFDEAINFVEANFNLSELAHAIPTVYLLLNLQRAYAGKGDYQQATYYLDRACETSAELDFLLGKLNCEKGRTRLYKLQNRFEEALVASKSAFKLQQDMRSDEQAREMQALKTELAVLDKDVEIERINEAQRAQEQAYFQRLKLGLYTAIFLVVLLMAIYFMMRNRNRGVIAEQQVEITEAKLHVLQSQMHPHFIFNALVGVQNYILKSKKLLAFNYLGKFATLLNGVTKNNDNVYIEFQQEVHFIESYLAMEKLRFRDAFDFTISVDPSLEGCEREVPSMLIQPVVENALVHGLVELDYKGKLHVEFESYPQVDGIRCVVTDNGRGREAAHKNASKREEEKHLSIATVNVNARMKFLKLLGHKNAKVVIEDLYEESRPTGTRVSMDLPFQKI